jgi:hypothetical protein
MTFQHPVKNGRVPSQLFKNAHFLVDTKIKICKNIGVNCLLYPLKRPVKSKSHTLGEHHFKDMLDIFLLSQRFVSVLSLQINDMNVPIADRALLQAAGFHLLLTLGKEL